MQPSPICVEDDSKQHKDATGHISAYYDDKVSNRTDVLKSQGIFVRSKVLGKGSTVFLHG